MPPGATSTSISRLPDPGEPSPRRVATVLGIVFAFQIIAMLIMLAGGIALMITLARNNSLECTSRLSSDGSCLHHSYALGVGLLAGGLGLFFAGMAVSASYALRHVGAPMLGALRARRRVWDQQTDSNVTSLSQEE